MSRHRVYASLAFRLTSVLAAAFLAGGCATVPKTYRLGTLAGNRVLIPPGVAKPDAPQRNFTAAITPGGGVCLAGGEAVTVRPRGRKLRITVHREALAKQGLGWLNTWTAEAEAQACVKQGEGLTLAARILESVALDPYAPYRLMNSSDRMTSHVDLWAGERLQVVVPILRAGAEPDAPIMETAGVSGSGVHITVDVKAAPNLLGYETSWYDVRPKASGPGFGIQFVSAERYIRGQPQSTAEPVVNYLRFSPQAAYYRLFYKFDKEGGATTEMVLAAATRTELIRLTKEVDAASSRCDALAGQACAVIPKRSAVNPFVVVTVNGAALAVPPPGTVRSAIEAAGEHSPERVLPTLTVWKLHAGQLTAVEFDRASSEIFELIPGEGGQISWR